MIMGKEKWTQEMRNYVRKHYATGDLSKMAVRFGCSVQSIRTLAKRLGVKRKRKWNSESEDELRRLYPNKTNEELAKIFGSTKGSIVAKANELRLFKSKEFMLACSSKTCFRKGHVPANKGRKQTEYMSTDAIERSKKGWFPKGYTPSNRKPIGYEMRDVNGYLQVKTERGFVFKHVVVWEEAHGEVPKGCMVVFKDGNKDNVVLDNLELITRKENMERNSIMRYPPELQYTMRLIGTLNKKINKIEKDGKSRNSERKDAHDNRNAHEQQ